MEKGHIDILFFLINLIENVSKIGMTDSTHQLAVYSVCTHESCHTFKLYGIPVICVVDIHLSDRLLIVNV